MSDLRAADVVLAIYSALVAAVAVHTYPVLLRRPDASFAAMPLVLVTLPLSLATGCLISAVDRRFPEAWTRAGYDLGVIGGFVLTGLAQAAVLWSFS